MATVESYLALIPSQHATRSKYTNMVSAVAQCFVDLQNFLQGVPGAFDLDTAQGTQLDQVAKWIGINRNVQIPVAVYFSFDTTGLGFEEGIWYLPFQPLTGKSQMDDDTFRIVLRAKIMANHLPGDTNSLIAILQEVFSPATVTVTDNMDMSITVNVTGSLPSVLFKTVVQQGYLPIKPAGLSITYNFS